MIPDAAGWRAKQRRSRDLPDEVDCMQPEADSAKTGVVDYWDHISEYEIDDSWSRHLSLAFLDYREKFALAQGRQYLAPFPLAIEIEPSYYCNLECPFCPRVVSMGQRDVGHMSPELWQAILTECRENQLSSMLMDHEAESLMNPRFLEMVTEASEAGILDLWLHTNANMLKSETSAQLIDAGLTKINFSIDATRAATYEILRVGGNFSRVIENVREFLRIKNEKGAHYLRTRVSFVEQQANITEKRAFFDFWKREPGLNVVTYQENIDFTPFEKPDEDNRLSEGELETKYSDAEPFHCSLPWEMPVIDTQGTVIPCGAPVREHTRDFILGNITEGDTIKGCWNGEQMNQLRDLHSKGEWYKNPMCRVCVNTLRSSRRRLAKLRQLAGKGPAGELPKAG
jgi:radical SAM protein with 4Fe4S-binding SPASM domain